MPAERRSHARIATDIPCTVAYGGASMTGRMRDVSVVGAQLVFDGEVASEREVIDLRVEETEGRPPLHVRARVMYARARSGVVVLGVQLVELDAAAHRAVHRFVAAALEGEGGGGREHARVHHRIEVTCGTKERARAVLENVSKGGIGVLLEGEARPGDEITVTVRVGRMPEALVLPGQVVRAQADGTGRSRAGVRFGELPQATTRLLDQLLRTLATPP